MAPADPDVMTNGRASVDLDGQQNGGPVGRTIFVERGGAWFAGAIPGDQAHRQLADRFAALVAAWQSACGKIRFAERIPV